MTTTLDLRNRSAVLDAEHVGDIRGALGTIRLDDTAPRRGRSAVLKTLLAIVGPGLIVMVGDNDAGAFATYGQAGQNYGTKLLWTLLLLVPVLYVNQEMVLRLWAVNGVGQRRAAGHRDAADHGDRRHDGGAVAAVLPAELRHRQADHAAVHEVREGRPRHRHRLRGRRRRGTDGGHGCRVRAHAWLRAVHRHRRACPRPAGLRRPDRR